jgi:hypothetical protein
VLLSEIPVLKDGTMVDVSGLTVDEVYKRVEDMGRLH